jgi:hypothetical protein
VDTATQPDLVKLDLVELAGGEDVVTVRCCLARQDESPAGCDLRFVEEPCP